MGYACQHIPPVLWPAVLVPRLRRELRVNTTRQHEEPRRENCFIVKTNPFHAIADIHILYFSVLPSKKPESLMGEVFIYIKHQVWWKQSRGSTCIYVFYSMLGIRRRIMNESPASITMAINCWKQAWCKQTCTDRRRVLRPDVMKDISVTSARLSLMTAWCQQDSLKAQHQGESVWCRWVLKCDVTKDINVLGISE